MNPLALLTALMPAIQTAGPILAGLYPALQPALMALSGVNPSNHQSIVTLIQEALNALQAAGVVSFGAPLQVDGKFGGGTFAAMKAISAKAGFPLAEPWASIVYKILQGFLA